MKKYSVPLMNSEFLAEARQAFLPADITPQTTKEQIMFDAGAVKLLNWLERKLGTEAVSGIVAETVATDLADSTEGAMRRFMRGQA